MQLSSSCSQKISILQNMCPMNVFDIEDLGASETTAKKGKGAKSVKPSASSSSAEGQSATARAVVARPRDCTMCRECVRHVDRGWDQRVVVNLVDASLLVCFLYGCS